jgi:hypothetical protein
MSVTDIRHGGSMSDDVAQAAADIKAALRDLPMEKQEVVQDRLFEVAAQYQATGQVDPLIHYVQSLLMTARLHRNPAYRKSLEEADREPVGETTTVADFMQRMRERHG